MAGKFKVGDKLKIPKRKSTGGPELEYCSLIKNTRHLKQDYCYITAVQNSSCYTVAQSLSHANSTFHEDDLELYDSEVVNNNYSIF